VTVVNNEGAEHAEYIESARFQFLAPSRCGHCGIGWTHDVVIVQLQQQGGTEDGEVVCPSCGGRHDVFYKRGDEETVSTFRITPKKPKLVQDDPGTTDGRP
jgi:hypothetical protein